MPIYSGRKEKGRKPLLGQVSGFWNHPITQRNNQTPNNTLFQICPELSFPVNYIVVKTVIETNTTIRGKTQQWRERNHPRVG